MLKRKENPGVNVSSFWYNQDDIDGILQPAPIESELNLEFVDIPRIHTYTDECAHDFMAALGSTQEMELFNQKPIKKLIEYKWPLVKYYTIRKLFLPFVGYLLCYMIYMNEIYYRRQQSDAWMIVNYILMVPLLFFALYFIGMEIQQLVKSGFSYFKSFWNYLDFLPPILLIIFLSLEMAGHFDLIVKTDRVRIDVKDAKGKVIGYDYEERQEKHLQNQGIEASFQATMSLMLWIKFLYFFRIFQATGYLIRIIIEVVIDMRHFLLIMLLTIIAFGDAMRSISTSNEEETQFIPNYYHAFTYTYRMILGDFSSDDFGAVAVPYMWVLFILCTVFNMIIMLNLLIAIISESFAKINSVSVQASYQEKADIIAENTYLIPESVKRSFTDETKYLLIASDVAAELKEKGDAIEFKLESMITKINNHSNTIETSLKTEISGAQDQYKSELQRTINQVKEENTKVFTLLEELKARLALQEQ